MHYVVVSFSHKNCDLAIREKLAFDEQGLHKAYGVLQQGGIVNEAVILSTCNRVEVYVSAKDPHTALSAIFKVLALHSGLDELELQGRADSFEDEGAIHHIFSVASSLDSLVIGETQITGQVKDAYKFAQEHGYCTQKLGRVMGWAFRCAATVRSRTDITKNPVSVASAAVAKAKEVCFTLVDVDVVVVGAGEMGRLAAKHLATGGARVTLINRTLQRAQDIASEIGEGVSVAPYEELEKLVERCTLLFTAITSEKPIITKHMVHEEKRRFWFDLAVPRNIDMFSHPGLSTFWVDDLRDIVEKNVTLREEQAKVAYMLVGQFTQEFFKQLQALSLDPIIKALRQKAQEASLKEIDRFIKKGYLPKEHEESFQKLLHGAFNTFLHAPTTRLKEIACLSESDMMVDVVKYLFDIEENPLATQNVCQEIYERGE